MSSYSQPPLYGQYQNGQHHNGQFPPPPLPPPPPGNYAMMPHMAQFRKPDSMPAGAGYRVSNSSPNPNMAAFTANRLHPPFPNGNAPYIPPLPHTFYPYSPFQNGAPPLPYPPFPTDQSPIQEGITPAGKSVGEKLSPSGKRPWSDQNMPMEITMAEESDKEMEDKSSVDLFAADREDGELSDSEVNNEPKAMSPSRSPSQADFIRLASKQAMVSETTGGPQVRDVEAPETNVKPGFTTGEREMMQMSKVFNSMPNVEPTGKGPSHTSEESIRQQVKAALQDLHQHGIGFDNLVSEGLDPNTLRALYGEVGIHVPSPLLQRSPVPNPLAPTPPTSGLSSSPEKAPATKASTPATVIPKANNPTSIQVASSQTSTVAETSSPLRPDETVNSIDQKLQPKPPPVTELAAKSAASESNKASESEKSSMKPAASIKPLQSGAPSEKGVDKVIDRKDYIAKLMAAKGNKGSSTKFVKQASVTKEDPIPKPSPATSASQAAKSGEGDPKSSSTQAAPSEAETKRAAQTELARKKMEALKQRNMSKAGESTKREVQKSAATTKSGTPQKESLPLTDTKSSAKPTTIPAPLIQSNSTSSSQAPAPFTPSTSFFSSLGRSLTTGIPGLLMGNSSSPSYFPSTGSSANLTAAVTSTILPIRRGSQPDSDSGLSLPDQIHNNLPQTTSKEAGQSDGSASNSEQAIAKPGTLVDSSKSNVPRVSTPKAITANAEPSRKRPTASDFIDAPPSRLKRRLGSDQQDNIILVFSDEDSEEETDKMDVEVSALLNSTASIPVAEVGTRKAIRDLPPLSDFPPRPKSLVNSSTGTPQIPTPVKAKEQEVLKAKEEQILAMQRRIAEMEMKRASKRATGFSSPEPSHRKEVARSGSNPAEPRQVLQSPFRQTSESKASQSVTEENQPAVQAIEDTKAPLPNEPNSRNQIPIPEHEAKQVSMARNSHQSAKTVDLEQRTPQIDDKIRAIHSRLEVAKREVATLEEELRVVLGDQRKTLEELDQLKQNAHSSPAANHVFSLENDYANETVVSHPSVLQPAFESSEEAKPSAIRSAAALPEQPKDLQTNSQSGTPEPPKFATQPSQTVESTSPIPHDPHDPPVNHHHRMASFGDVMDISSSSTSSDEGEVQESSPGRAIDQQAQIKVDGNQVQAQAVTQQGGERKSHSPDTNQSRSSDEAGSTVVEASKASHADIFSDGTDFYEPKETQVTIKLEESGATEPLHDPRPGIDDVNQGAVPSAPIVLDEDEDDYEPPESISPAPPVDNDAMSVDSCSPPASDIPLEVSARPVVEPAVQTISDSPATDIQAPQNTETVQLFETIAPNVQEARPKTPRPQAAQFKPYESPLSIFTSFRNHPAYTSQVSNGFRSLTYSHKIKPGEPVCRWELAGGTCNDSSCDGQHFRDMKLSDDMILAQLGSSSGSYTKEQKESYVSGLRAIISDLRGQKINDFDEVASRIAGYRRSFLGDESRIINDL